MCDYANDSIKIINDDFMIYGAGIIAKDLFNLYCTIDKGFDNKFKGFIVTYKDDNPHVYCGYPVFVKEEISNKDITVIIGVKNTYEDIITDGLKKDGFSNILTRIQIGLLYDPRYYLLKSACIEDYPRVICKWYFERTGSVLDLVNPKTFNEKIQWLKLNDSTRQKTILADKYLVREWVAETIGPEYLVPLLGVWKSFDDIDFDKLPESFVLKCNHGSGWNAVIEHKNQMSKTDLKEKFSLWMQLNYAFSSLELHYKDIEPRIIAEEMLQSDDGEDLKDYKLFVFDGKVKLIQVDIDRFHEHKRNLYTPEWEYVSGEICYPTAPEIVVEKPDELEELIHLAEVLGKGFCHVRVDFYIAKGKIYFGEMTFTHGSGTERFYPEELAIEMGEWIHLPEKNG